MLKRIRNCIVCAVLVVSVYAQGTDPQKPAQQPEDKKEIVDKDLAAASKGPAAAVDPNNFKLGIEDVVHLDVWHDADFSRTHLIRPDGKISLQIVGEIQAAGLTPVQLAKKVSEALSVIIKDPQVNVTVLQVNSKKFYVQGEVGRPGTFPLVVKTTVMDALSNCGGFKDFANKKKIIILRRGQQYKFNYTEYVKGKNQDQNILIENGDYIIVN